MARQDVHVFVSYARANKYLASRFLRHFKEQEVSRLDRPSFSEPKAFADGKGSRRDDFALELFRLVEARVAWVFPDRRARSRRAAVPASGREPSW